MKKKILIGSIIAVILLLLMPSIPAIQQNTIEEGFKQEIQKKLDTITLDDLKDIKPLDDDIKHPILYFLVMLVDDIRLTRFLLVGVIASTFIDWDEFGNLRRINPILLLFFIGRALWIFSTLYLWELFWLIISNELEWNWFED